ncbi:MAG: hypothetical protein FRX48_01331 [Lasallia pustulata]|uniref:UmuC domain-containing protein n=1 Tax=Lasallia pustulata TaxID=136370 RepID=A0A5M8PXW7_9LECA|nr:MAG: hypothetical protein FRX48_01331 [Lasallia pustulata]
MGRSQPANRAAERDDGRIIIHFDYDCFYASVFEAENPALRSLPLAVQQKQIIVTCNYEARRRGLHKLQLIREARKKCPDVIVVLGEDLTRFRNASKELYHFLQGFCWSRKVERLGFDEVFLDVTDVIDYNLDLLNHNDLIHSFFHLDRSDPTVGFAYDASHVSGPTFPIGLSTASSPPPSTAKLSEDPLELRLRLGGHLAQHIRHKLEEHKGYTATVGVSTNKLLSKLVGNLNKPKGQTTLVPPYVASSDREESNVTTFIDAHDIGKIPGIGFKLAQKIRHHVLGREATFHAGLVYSIKENVTVKDVRLYPGMSGELLENLLGGPGFPKGIGAKIWSLIHGVDNTEVGKARKVPQQISIEDSYTRLDTMQEIRKELNMLASSLIKRMQVDLTEADDEDDPPMKEEEESSATITTTEHKGPVVRRWIAHPRTLRLTTRPRPPSNPDGSRTRSFNRISRSCPMPMFVFSLTESVDALADKLVNDALIPAFRKLHPDKSGWNLSLVNVGATNMAEAATDSKDGAGRDIGKMFRKQTDMLKEWKVEDRDVAPTNDNERENIPSDNTIRMEEGWDPRRGFGAGLLSTKDPSLDNDIVDMEGEGFSSHGSKATLLSTRDGSVDDDAWHSEGDASDFGDACSICRAVVPPFAMLAHERFHAMPD